MKAVTCFHSKILVPVVIVMVVVDIWFIKNTRGEEYFVLSVLMVFMALQTWEIFQDIPSMNLLSISKARETIGAFIAGILGGVFSSPCSTPVLIALLAIVAGKENLFWRILLIGFICFG